MEKYLIGKKKWTEEFDNYKLEENGKWKIDRVFAKQFISDLRKRDMEALIELLPFNHRDDMGGLVEDIKERIKDYYEN